MTGCQSPSSERVWSSESLAEVASDPCPAPGGSALPNSRPIPG